MQGMKKNENEFLDYVKMLKYPKTTPAIRKTDGEIYHSLVEVFSFYVPEKHSINYFIGRSSDLHLL